MRKASLWAAFRALMLKGNTTRNQENNPDLAWAQNAQNEDAEDTGLVAEYNTSKQDPKRMRQLQEEQNYFIAQHLHERKTRTRKNKKRKNVVHAVRALRMLTYHSFLGNIQRKHSKPSWKNFAENLPLLYHRKKRKTLRERAVKVC